PPCLDENNRACGREDCDFCTACRQIQEAFHENDTARVARILEEYTEKEIRRRAAIAAERAMSY
ncbi:MAG: hypothetical protein R3251_04470, partial [Candidatus Spechtbacterales bacterium]|nr:hypothetical protein [Candidatus Spechtbacterales bacterium]